jgi:hypothetical protein
MIVSDAHKYVFIQFPHTGCTAVGRELVDHYGGRPVLTKHAAYHDFLRWRGPAARDYFAFSAIRNPLDEIVSFYFKLKTDHRGDYSNPDNHTENGGWVNPRLRRHFRFIHDAQAGFIDYVARFHPLPYVNWSVLAHKRLDAVMRYERLQDDFAAVLTSLGLQQVRPLPLVNPTRKGAVHPLQALNAEERRRLQWIFGPMMRYWGYAWPEGWAEPRAPLSSELGFQLMRLVKTTYWLRIR